MQEEPIKSVLDGAWIPFSPCICAYQALADSFFFINGRPYILIRRDIKTATFCLTQLFQNNISVDFSPKWPKNSNSYGQNLQRGSHIYEAKLLEGQPQVLMYKQQQKKNIGGGVAALPLAPQFCIVLK